MSTTGITLTFQSMVEKNACRLISSTPSGPAPGIEYTTVCPSQYYKPRRSAFIHTTRDLPKRFEGFLLKSIRKRLCASRLRNCGIPSFALRCKNHNVTSILWAQPSWSLNKLTVIGFASQYDIYLEALIKDSTNQASHTLACFNMQPHLLKNHVHSLVPVFSLER